LNLSAEKQQQIRDRIRGIREAAKVEMNKILTTEQQQQLEQRRQMKRQTSGNQPRQNRPSQRPVQPGTVQ
jgi:Spy/CpxP family protein refolding chaperone